MLVRSTALRVHAHGGACALGPSDLSARFSARHRGNVRHASRESAVRGLCLSRRFLRFSLRALVDNSDVSNADTNGLTAFTHFTQTGPLAGCRTLELEMSFWKTMLCFGFAFAVVVSGCREQEEG